MGLSECGWNVCRRGVFIDLAGFTPELLKDNLLDLFAGIKHADSNIRIRKIKAPFIYPSVDAFFNFILLVIHRVRRASGYSEQENGLYLALLALSPGHGASRRTSGFLSEGTCPIFNRPTT